MCVRERGVASELEGVDGNGEDAGEARAQEVASPPGSGGSGGAHGSAGRRRRLTVSLLHAAAAAAGRRGPGRPAGRAQHQGLRISVDREDADGVPEQGHRGMRRPDRSQARVPAAVLQRQRQVTHQ